MKRIIALVLCVACCLSLVACGGNKSSNQYAKVTYKDGTTETLKAGEICGLYRENKTAYNVKFAGNAVELVTKVNFIGGSNRYGECELSTTSGMNMFLDDNDPIIPLLRSGMLIKVTGMLQEGTYTIAEKSVSIVE